MSTHHVGFGAKITDLAQFTVPAVKGLICVFIVPIKSTTARYRSAVRTDRMAGEDGNKVALPYRMESNSCVIVYNYISNKCFPIKIPLCPIPFVYIMFNTFTTELHNPKLFRSAQFLPHIKHTGSHYNHLSETIQMSTHHVGFGAKIKELSQFLFSHFWFQQLKG